MTFQFALALLSLLVAVASALYARRAGRAAAEANVIALKANEISLKANDIALHDRRLEFLEAFKKYWNEMQWRGEDVPFNVLNELTYAADRAKLYFPAALAVEIESFADAAYELSIREGHVKRLEGANMTVPQAKREAVFEQSDSCKELARQLLPKLEAAVTLVR